MTGKSRTARLTQRTVRCAAALAVAALLAPAAHAFTFEDGKGNTIPKFDLEEQMRQFRKLDLDTSSAANTSSAAKKSMETPIGTFQFRVNRGFSSFGPSSGGRASNADRRHYDRLFAPDSMKSLYD